MTRIYAPRAPRTPRPRRWLPLLRPACGALLAAACALAAAADLEPRQAKVVFVCEHGSAKSLVAASLFNRIAEERGLSVRAISRAVSEKTVDHSVPAPLVKNMAQDGFEVGGFTPVPLRAEEAAHADQVVVIAYDGAVDSAAGAPVEHWNDIAPVGTEYATARDRLQSHIEQLLLKVGQPAVPAR